MLHLDAVAHRGPNNQHWDQHKSSYFLEFSVSESSLFIAAWMSMKIRLP